MGLGKCSVCGNEASVEYPLLPGTPRFCSTHHNPKDAGTFGVDLTGPDDFDIPIPEIEIPLAPKWSQKARTTFIWTDKEGFKHPLKTIDDKYLSNIINFLRRRIAELEEDPTIAEWVTIPSIARWTSIIDFLEREQKYRIKTKYVEGVPK